MSQNVPKATNALSPNLLGAHRYTIFDGIVRPSGSLAERHCPYKARGKRGSYSSPSVQKTHLPYCATSEQLYHKKPWQI